MYHHATGFERHAEPATAFVTSARIGRILLVEETSDVRHRILSHLEDRHCSATACGAMDALRQIQSQPFSLVLVNARCGGFSGLDILRQIRGRSHVPVILYRDGPPADMERIIGLELGADDVLSGPLNLDELLARARATLRRQQLGRLDPAPLQGGYSFEGWELSHATKQLTSPSGQAVGLTRSDYALLNALLEAPGRPLSRLHLMRATRTHEDIHDRSIDVQVLRLRRKLGRTASGESFIRTERGFGYVFDAQVRPLY